MTNHTSATCEIAAYKLQQKFPNNIQIDYDLYDSCNVHYVFNDINKDWKKILIPSFNYWNAFLVDQVGISYADYINQVGEELILLEKELIRNKNRWKTRFLELAKHIAKDSKDPSTKVGAVIVDDDNNVRTIGYNGFPRGVKDTPERLNDRKLKYPLTVHAELNALLTMARVGTPTKGTTMVCTHYPCSNCSGAMVQAGIKEVVVYSPNEDFKSRWNEDMKMSELILKEGGVEVVVIDDIVEVDDEI